MSDPHSIKVNPTDKHNKGMIELLREIAADSDNYGDPIYPDRYTMNFTYTATDKVETQSFTDGTSTWTKTYTYNVDDLVETISPWMKS